MSTSTIKHLVLITSPIALFAGSPASLADQQGGTEKLPLEEILVTAQKREQSVFEVPMSVVAIGGEELEQRRIFNLEDLGSAVPGVEAHENGFNRRIFIRGLFNDNGTSPLVGTYIDELPAATAELGGGYDLPDLQLHDVERVEVLRGPQGTLYGQGSMGGTVRFITHNPELDSFGFSANVSASSTSDGDSSQRIRGILNIPLVEDQLGLRISTTFLNAGGWIDQPAVDRKDINDQSLTNIRLKSLWRPSDALDVTATAIVHRNDAGAPNLGEDDAGNYTTQFFLPVTPSVEDDYELYNLTFTYDFGTVLLTSSSSYNTVDREIENSGRSVPFFPPPLPLFETFEPLITVEADVFTQELRLSSGGEGLWQWTVGGIYKDLDSNLEGSAFVGLAGFPFALAFEVPRPSEQLSESWAVFGDISYDISDRFEIGVGMRYFEDDREEDNATQSATFDAVTPRIYGAFNASENIRIYASFAEGFRSGGFNSLGQPPFDAESVSTYELGTKMSLLDDRLDAEISLFYSEYDDYVVGGVLPPPAPPVRVSFNAGDAEITGVDWTITWRSTDNFSLSVSGTYVDAEFVAINSNLISGASHEVGDPLDAIPPFSATVSANYDFSWRDKPGFVYLEYNHQDSSQLRNRGIGAHFIAESDVIDKLNFNIGWQLNENFSMGFFGRNLLDDRGWLQPSWIFGTGSRSRPRTLGIEFTADFF